MTTSIRRGYNSNNSHNSHSRSRSGSDGVPSLPYVFDGSSLPEFVGPNSARLSVHRSKTHSQRRGRRRRTTVGRQQQSREWKREQERERGRHQTATTMMQSIQQQLQQFTEQVSPMYARNSSNNNNNKKATPPARRSYTLPDSTYSRIEVPHESEIETNPSRLQKPKVLREMKQLLLEGESVNSSRRSGSREQQDQQQSQRVRLLRNKKRKIDAHLAALRHFIDSMHVFKPVLSTIHQQLQAFCQESYDELQRHTAVQSQLYHAQTDSKLIVEEATQRFQRNEQRKDDEIHQLKHEIKQLRIAETRTAAQMRGLNAQLEEQHARVADKEQSNVALAKALQRYDRVRLKSEECLQDQSRVIASLKEQLQRANQQIARLQSETKHLLHIGDSNSDDDYNGDDDTKT